MKPGVGVARSRTLKTIARALPQAQPATCGVMSLSNQGKSPGYTLPDVPVPDTAGRGGRYVGTSGQFRADCGLTPHIALALEAVHFAAVEALLFEPLNLVLRH